MTRPRVVEFLSRRGTFLVLYALTCIVVGVLNSASMDFSGLAPLRMVLGAASPKDMLRNFGSILWSTLSGQFDQAAYAICLLGPLIMVALAFLRGWRLKKYYLFVFPILSVFYTLVGLPIFVFALGQGTALAAGWVFDAWCLYLGAQSEFRDEAA